MPIAPRIRHRPHPTPSYLLGLFLLLVAARPAPGIEILAPLDQTVVREDTLLILGTAARGQRVAWSIRSPAGLLEDEVRADWGDLFEIFVLLDPGLNEIWVGDRRVRVFFAPGGEQAPPGYAPQRVHAGDISRCEDCHDPVSRELRDGGYPGVCLGCHVVVATNPAYRGSAEDAPHFREAVARCGRCHTAHVATDPKLLRGPASALCTRCHASRRPGPDVHPAYGERGCVTCHDPHFSGYPAELYGPETELCRRCHAAGATADPPHPPATRARACTRCHDPHAGGDELLPDGGSAPCIPCHTGVDPGGHHGAIPGCGTCHDPHDPGGEPSRERTDRACSGCHGEVGRGRTVHAALEKGCPACHDPHRDRDPAVARAACGRCHDPAGDAELRSLHGNLSVPPDACTLCHPPHASQRDQLVRGRLHDPLHQGRCTVCHGGGDDRSILVEDPGARCRMCHALGSAAPGGPPRPHPPVADGDCTACHDPHLSVLPALLRGDQSGMCGRCHGEVLPGDGRRRHPPAAVCTACHAAHGGGGPAFLSKPVPGLCLGCHDDPRDGLEKPHPALDDGCVPCHDPHAGYGPGLLRARGDAVCLRCHDRDGHPHPLDAAAGARLPGAAGFPVDGETYACTGCHQPHASDRPGLFVRPREVLCQECHEAR